MPEQCRLKSGAAKGAWLQYVDVGIAEEQAVAMASGAAKTVRNTACGY